MDIFYLIQVFADYIAYTLLHLNGSHLWEALDFFIYDSIKIIILLIFVVHLMTVINHFLPIEKIRDFLSKNKLYWFDYVLSSLFWAITPFCSCSSIPMFVWFLKAWIPIWITFTFLITSPLINEVMIAMLIWLFWWKVTAIYVGSWMILWMIWWLIIGKMNMEKEVAEFIWKKSSIQNEIAKEEIKFKKFLVQVSEDSFSLIRKIIPYVILWVAIWWLIHWFIPTWFFENYITKNNIFAVPVAVIFWVPMYANATSIIPIIQALIAKWIPLWTWLAFMMAVVWLSLPEFLILKKVMSIKLLSVFFWIISLFMILLWYFFNIVL